MNAFTFGPFPGPRPNLKRRLCEAQNHRCCVCGTGLETLAYSSDEDRASIVAIDRDLPKNFANSVVMCARCAGYAANLPSVMAVYETYHATGLGPKEKTQVECPETVPLIRDHVVRLLIDRGHDILEFEIDEHYRFAPPERAETIARKVVHKIIREAEGHGRRPNPYKLQKFIGGGKRNAYKRMLLECQNHRCCYCGTVMRTDHSRHPRYATWEHVVALKEGGDWSLDNLVMACMVCNNMREQLDMTAHEFYEWAKDHLDLIEQRAQHLWEGKRNRRMPKRLFEMPKFPVYAYT